MSFQYETGGFYSSIYDSYDGWFPIGGGGGGGALQDTSGLQQFKFKEFKGNLRNFQV